MTSSAPEAAILSILEARSGKLITHELVDFLSRKFDSTTIQTALDQLVCDGRIKMDGDSICMLNNTNTNSHQLELPEVDESLGCGRWSLRLIIPFFPAAIILAIIAITRYTRALKLHNENPNIYPKPLKSGFQFGVVSLSIMLCILLFAIAISLS